MNFVCPELSGTDARTAVAGIIFQSLSYNAGTTTTIDKIKYTLIGTSIAESTTYIYCPTSVINFGNNISSGMTAQTLSELCTAFGITGTVDSNLTEDYYLKGSSVYDIQSNVFYTIYTNEGIIFTLPKRGDSATNLGKITDSLISSVVTMDCNDSTPEDRDINSPLVTILPASGQYTANETKFIAQKRNSKTSSIIFYAGTRTVNALDYCTYKGSIYVVMNKLLQDDGSYLYQAVLEDTTAYSTSAIDNYDSSRAKTTDAMSYDINDFCAYMSSVTSIPASAWTKVRLNAVSYDTDSKFNTSTYRYSPGVAGRYHFDAMVNFNLTATGLSTKIVYARVYRNGTSSDIILRGVTRQYNTDIFVTLNLSGDLYVNSTDYFELYVYTTLAGNINDAAMSAHRYA